MKLNLQSKILLGMAIIFLSLSIISTWSTLRHERQMMENMADKEAHNIAKSYFDALNTLMLTGAIAEKENLRKKILQNDEIRDIRLVRGEAIVNSFGQGSPEQQVTDELDKRGLTGESVKQMTEDWEGRVLIVLTPVIARANVNGTNCLTCHPVAEGSVLGAVRINYSLHDLDGAIQQNLLVSVLINMVLFVIAGIVVFAFTRSLMRQLGGEPDYAVATLRQLAQGDLAVDIQLKDNDKDSLLFAVSTLRDQLRNVVRVVLQNADRLGQVTRQVNRNTQNLSDLASHQAVQIEKTSDSITTLNQTVQKNAENAKVTNNRAVESANETSAGGAAVQRTLAAMQQIAGKIALIEDIAYKTNILSLNAAIEAASAGDKGKGFAVVASEIRKLADSSQITAHEIDELVENGLSIGQEAGQVLNALVPSIHQTAQLVGEISVSSAQQAQVIGEIHQAMLQMDQSAQQNATMSNQLAEAARQMDEQSRQLQCAVAFFKLKR